MRKRQRVGLRVTCLRYGRHICSARGLSLGCPFPPRTFPSGRPHLTPTPCKHPPSSATVCPAVTGANLRCKAAQVLNMCFVLATPRTFLVRRWPLASGANRFIGGATGVYVGFTQIFQSPRSKRSHEVLKKQKGLSSLFDPRANWWALCSLEQPCDLGCFRAGGVFLENVLFTSSKCN
ncbi:hypothetical protein K0M31_016465, partial [Melipona bicolor]